MRRHLLLLGSLLVFLTGCSSVSEPVDQSASQQASQSPPAGPSEPASGSPGLRLMPDLLGMPSAKAGARLGKMDLASNWGRPITVRCEARPRTVVSQRPAPGTPLRSDTAVHIRTAALDLEEFRGPCKPHDQHVGQVAAADAALARKFYRFASDQSLGAPFASGEVWVGIEDGMKSTSLDDGERGDLKAWELDTGYAERSGPFSPLDTLVESGGYYELRHGVVGTCPRGNDQAPPELIDLRAISLTAPEDVTSACLDWWGVTLFVDSRDRIRGVAFRLGSP